MNGSKIGSGDKVLDWGVIIAALILFAKTADLLSYFAPAILSDIVGADVSLIYGIVTAALVEGLALALHFNRKAALSSTAQVVKWVLIAISGVCQVFDGFVSTNSVAQLSDTLKIALSWGVPLIPLSIMVMVFGIGQLPELGMEVQRQKEPFIGLKPMWRRMLNGDTVPPPARELPSILGLDIPPHGLGSFKSNQNSDVKNPTIGEQS